MHEGTERLPGPDDANTSAAECPDWCVAGHGVHGGEEDWIHVGEPLFVADGGTTARLCMSVDPETGARDGPYVLIGSSEYTPAAALALGRALMAMATAATPGDTKQELP
ncbi:DUF6907 domain-containing protein [Kocuria sp. M4R2S49]|uniref:DUF6907 domain-containing protein n=1 Tax=Kocuria rhizosphaericola TaxID=3376284 RepID=UPI00379989F9